MSYRNKLRKAAIFILQNICVEPDYKVTRIFDKDINVKTYQWKKLSDLKMKSSKFSLDLLREAVEFLYEKRYIDFLDNITDRFDIRVMGTTEGEHALKENIYQEDIKTYNHDRIYRSVRWIIPILSFLIAAFSLVYTVYKVNSLSKQIVNIQERIQRLESIKPVKPVVDSTSHPARKSNQVSDKAS